MKKKRKRTFPRNLPFFKHCHLFRALEIFFSVPVLPSFSGFRKIMLRFDLVTTKLFFNRKKTNKKRKKRKGGRYGPVPARFPAAPLGTTMVTVGASRRQRFRNR